MAIFHELINGNPAGDLPSMPEPRDKKKTVAVKDLHAVRGVIHEWANGERRKGLKSMDRPDIVELLIATDIRIGHLLALR